MGASRVPSRFAACAVIPVYNHEHAIARVVDGAAMATARRVAGQDSIANRWRRRAFNGLVRFLIGGELRDLSSGVRAARTEVLRALPIYGDFLRFLPAFAQREGYRVDEVSIPQHAVDLRNRHHAPGTYVRRFFDLLAVFFLVRFREKPLRFFGLIGGSLTLAGLLMLVVLVVQRIGGTPIGDRPVLVLGVLLFVLGVQGVALGLLGEIIVFASARRSAPYRLVEVVLPAK